MKTILYGLVLLPVVLFAQINESDSISVKAGLALTGVWQSGNVETRIFRTKSDFSVKPGKPWVFKTTNSYVYQEFGKVKADEDILSLNFLYLNPQRKLYPFVLGIASTNFRREIDIRFLFGAGATLQLLNEKTFWLKLSISSEYETTEFASADFNRSAYDGSPSIRTYRGTVWIYGKYFLHNKKIVLSHEAYVQPSLEKSDNYRWQADLGLELPFWKFLNFRINYLDVFESVVIENQKQHDRLLTFGFSVKNY